MIKKVLREILIIGILMCSITGCGRKRGEWYEEYPVVCHALGMTEEGDSLTNSREALEYNYILGQRVFETDIAITSDNVAVLRHDWVSDLGQGQRFGWTDETKKVPTAKEFLQAPIYGKYTPLTLLELYEEMAEKEDMYVVLDPKYTPDVEKQFTLIVNTALENGYESVLDRIVVQLYYEQMYEEVEAVYPFKNYLYTLYYIGYPGEQAIAFCAEHGIPVLTMPYTWYEDIHEQVQQDLGERSVRIYVHTVDEQEDAENMASLKADGIYSDCILPKEMGQWMEKAKDF